MPTWVTAVLNWLGKFSPRYAVVLVILTGVLLFAPDTFLRYFGVDVFAHAYRGYIFLVFGFSAILTVTYPAEHVGKFVSGRIAKYQYQRHIEENLLNLGSDQIAILSEYAQSGKSTIWIPHDQMALAEDLISKGILNRHAQPDSGGGFCYTLSSQASRLLRYKKFQEILSVRDEKQSE
jgi:superinfection exclusion protein B